jgi:hypothetical protein
MTTLNISCHQPVQIPVSFNDIYSLKNEWVALYNNKIELHNVLFKHLTDLMESINNDVLKQNKIRYKQFQRQKQGEESSPAPNWRNSKPPTKLSALSSQLEGVDKSKLALNRELNKLSPSNFDLIVTSIMQVFTEFITASVLENGTQTALDKSFYSNWDNYVQHLWHLLINKTLTQSNYSDIYFRFMNKFICINDVDFLDKWKNGTATIISLNIGNKIVNELTGKIGFRQLETNKKALVGEMIAFMKNSNYLATNNLLYELLGDVMNNSCENIFNTLGKFVKFFTEVERGRKISRAEKTAYDVLLLALYDNFKTINDLVQWEPINTDELEKRVYFTIGFFNDNLRFIQGLDMDFYRDMECQLDSLKRTDTIPTTVKYKLFDCIDNFIGCRFKKQ